MKTKVRCVNNSGGQENLLIVGKTYDVIWEDEFLYYLSTDQIWLGPFLKYRFENLGESYGA